MGFRRESDAISPSENTILFMNGKETAKIDVKTTAESGGVQTFWTKNPALFVIGGIIVLFVAASAISFNRIKETPFWKNVSFAAVSFSSLFVPSEHIDVSAPSPVTAGGNFTVAFNHAGKRGTGSYSISYSCANGLFFHLVENTASMPLYCDTPADITSLATTSLSLMPVLSGSADATTTITIRYDKAAGSPGANPVIGSADIEIVKSSIQTGTTTASGAAVPPSTKTVGTSTVRAAGPETEHLYQYGTAGTTTTYYGTGTPAAISNGVDLTARILGLGVVDKTTNQFTATSTFKAADRIAVRFEVQNIGTKTSPQWSFAAVLPTFPPFIFQSPTEQSLAPGDRIEFTLGFDNINQADGNVVTINVDNTNSIGDIHRADKIASTTINNVKF